MGGTGMQRIDGWDTTDKGYTGFREGPTVTYRSTSAYSPRTDEPGEISPNRASGEVVPQGKEVQTRPEDFYPHLADTDAFKRAIALLDNALLRVDSAAECLRIGAFIAADDEMQQIQSALPELFCCRSLGDGFGAIINAVQIGFNERRGVALEHLQVEAVAKALRRLRRSPFLSIDEAVRLLIMLEDSGLAVEPQSLTGLLEGPDEQGLR